MARAWRIEFTDAFYHVLSRCNRRQAIFYDDHDRHLFLKTTGEMSERFEMVSNQDVTQSLKNLAASYEECSAVQQNLRGMRSLFRFNHQKERLL